MRNLLNTLLWLLETWGSDGKAAEEGDGEVLELHFEVSGVY